MKIDTQEIYTRNMQDDALCNNAKQSLLEHSNYSPSEDYITKIQDIIASILRKYQLSIDNTFNIDDVDLLLDAMLDSVNVLHEKSKISILNTKYNTYRALGFLTDGTPVEIYPSMFSYWIINPTTGKREKLIKSKMEEDIYIIHKPFTTNSTSFKNIFLSILRFFYARDVAAIIIFTFLSTVLGLSIPIANNIVIERIIPQGNAGISSLIATALIFVSVCIFRALSDFLKNKILNRTKARVSAQVQTAFMTKLLTLPLYTLYRKDTGRLSVSLQYTQQLTELVVNLMLNGLLMTIFSLIYIVQMIGYNVYLSAIANISLVILAAISIGISIINIKNEESRLEYNTQSSSLLFSSIIGMQNVKTAGAEKRVYSKWANLYKKVLSHTINPIFFIKYKQAIIQSLSMLINVALLIIAVKANIQQADYVAFIAAYNLTYNAISSFTNIFDQYCNILPLMNKTMFIMNAKNDPSSSYEFAQSLNGYIEFDNVSFKYEGTEKQILDNLSFSLEPGKKIAIVGESGCGKSTLLKLLLGLLLPDSGAIYYDNMNLSRMNTRSVRKQIASILQFSRLIPGTIYENISYNSAKVSLDDAWKAAKMADIHHDIEKLSLKMDTTISESANGGFSGGQLQRIMLARAFASKSKLLILDEATSALDSITQNHVLDSIYSLDCSAIIVAHRLSTITKCDKIYMLKDGKFIESGTYSELMKKNGEFANLVKRQNEQVAQI